MLARLEPTCLEGAVVRQSWLASHGEYVDIIIGVTTDGGSPTRAHAWLDGRTPEYEYAAYKEIHRVPGRSTPWR